MSDWAILRSLFSGSPREREVRETRQAWESCERRWQATAASKTSLSQLSLQIVERAMRLRTPPPAAPVFEALADATYTILTAEDFAPIEPKWRAIEGDPAVAIEFRQMIPRRARWAADFETRFELLSRHLLSAYEVFIEQLPEACCRPWRGEDERGLEVPLLELLDDPAELIEEFARIPYNDDAQAAELFVELREFFQRNYLVASGYPPDLVRSDRPLTFIQPSEQRGKTPTQLADQYLRGLPFRELLDLPVPFDVPDDARFEHCHIVGGTGHGKTQLMQRMIHADLVRARYEKRSVVVIDSQGDLINKLMRLDLFDPDERRSLADRLVIIDPSDVEFPAALNLFDAHLDRVRDYRPVDRERVLNGVIELYETFFGSMLGAELTQKQGVIFRYLARLMISIPGATIHTLMQLMEDGRPFKKYMDELDGSARYFFATEFFHPSFAATKKQILKRLWGVLATPAFERMFAQKANKLDLFEAMNEGKIVLVSTAKDLLKSDGSALFGRFFIALLAQAALERSTIDEDERTPTFVYVDEAQEYFDDSVETILNQARKYKVGLTLAHQTLDQLSPRLRSALHANTSFKCVGGVSAKDARALADEMRTSSDFIEGMRRRGERTEFAVWLKHQTPQAIRLTVPIGFLERQPILTEEAFESVLEQNRARYCGTLADVVGFDFREPGPEPEAPRRTAPELSTAPPDEPIRGVPESTAREQPKPEPVESTRAEPRQREPLESREPGKGGSQHRYVQHMIKGLAEERGLRAMIEEAIDGGQVDVGLHQGDLSVACEISVTSKPDYEAQNIAKCLRAGFVRIWAISPDNKRRRAIMQSAQARLAPEDFSKVEFLTTDELVTALDSLTVPVPEEKVVAGYRVTSTRRAISPAEAKERRAAVARILATSMR